MSSLHMFLPASEPARSEALAQLQKTHHLPRHLVRGVARGGLGKRATVVSIAMQQSEQPPLAPLESQPPEPPLQAG
jgi:hypothetical protein